MRNASKKNKHPWPLYLFGLPFAGVSVGFLFFSILPTLYLWVDTKSWQPIQAQLLSTDLKTYSGDGTTYEVTARYEYVWQGKHYISDRVGISTGADNIGDWQETRARQLKYRLNKSGRVQVFVNPDDPAESVIYSDMRWGLTAFKMVFVLVFGGVGFGLIFWAWYSRGKVKVKHLSSTEPWLDYEGWANPITSDGKFQFYASLFFTLLWNAISAPLLFVLPQEISKGNYLAAVGLLFPAVGVFLAVWCYKSYRRWVRFGKLTLKMDPWPGQIGGQVGGQIQLPVEIDGLTKVTLSCINSYYSGTGKNRRRSEKVKWQKTGIVDAKRNATGMQLGFVFDVPDELPESQLKDDDYYLWRLNLNAELPGVDLDCNFEIPVFAGDQRSSLSMECASLHPQLSEERYVALEQLINAKPLPGGVELEFKMFRNPALNLGGFLFGSIFAGVGLFLFQTDAPWFMAIIFSLLGSLFALGFGFRFLNRYRVKIGERGLYTERYLFGIRISKRFIPPADIAALQLTSKGSSTVGNKHTEHFQVTAKLRNGKKVPVVESLNGRALAEDALEMLSLMSGYQMKK